MDEHEPGPGADASLPLCRAATDGHYSGMEVDEAASGAGDDTLPPVALSVDAELRALLRREVPERECDGEEDPSADAVPDVLLAPGPSLRDAEPPP
eukprot:4691305-Alexandrium_andersonii.AAC.1